jgi:hypothetical protein
MYSTVDRIHPRPRWCGLYVLAALLVALVGVVDAFMPTGAWRRALEIGIVVIGFGAMRLWVRANRLALDLAGARDAGFRTVVVPPAGEQDIEVTVTTSRDSKRVVGGDARRGGKRWTSSISA